MARDRIGRAKMLMVLALLRELRNKVLFYQSMVRRTRSRYAEFAEKTRHIMPEKARIAEREAMGLEMVELHLDRIAKLIERVMLRLETLVIANDVVGSLLLAKNVVKELKSSGIYTMPSLSIVVDRIDSVVNDLLNDLKAYGVDKNILVVRESEVKKIVEEAKKVAELESSGR